VWGELEGEGTMTSDSPWRLMAFYRGELDRRLDGILAHLVGKPIYGSGSTSEVRDLEWRFKERRNALSARNRINRIYGQQLHLCVRRTMND